MILLLVEKVLPDALTVARQQWAGNTSDKRVYGLLAEIKDDEVESFFADYLIKDDKEHPEIKKIIDKYFLA